MTADVPMYSELITHDKHSWTFTITTGNSQVTTKNLGGSRHF